jgi:hypothetical protein
VTRFFWPDAVFSHLFKYLDSLNAENAKLKKLLAECALDIEFLKEGDSRK